jgi:hypothetical protein
MELRGATSKAWRWGIPLSIEWGNSFSARWGIPVSEYWGFFFSPIWGKSLSKEWGNTLAIYIWSISVIKTLLTVFQCSADTQARTFYDSYDLHLFTL